MPAADSVAPLADGNGRSQCYSCRHWDWTIDIGRQSPARWIHTCSSAIEGLTPGDCVINCPGYERARKHFGANVAEDGMIG